MRTDIMAKDYLQRAEVRITDATNALERGDVPEAIRYSQEGVELSLKAALRLVAIEYPREHEVSDALLYHEERFPTTFSHHFPKLARISKELFLKRGPAMYGDEGKGIPPSELFTKANAEQALQDARWVLAQVQAFFEAFFSVKPAKK